MANFITKTFRDRKFLALILAVFGILLIGVVFYSNVEHWRVIDSLYFSVVTLTTVGYGDLAPHTDLGKLFTVFYLLLGVGVLLALVAAIAEQTINNYRKIAETYIIRDEKGGMTEKIFKRDR